MRYNLIISLFLLLSYTTARSERTAILLPEGINNKLVFEFNKGKGEDTLHPPWEGPFYIGWQAGYRVEYEATKLTPSSPCSVITIAHGVGSPTAGASKACSVFIWNDASGKPGTVLYKARVTATVTNANTIQLNWHSVTSPVYVTGAFWVGNYEMDTLFPTSALDSIMSYPTKYSTNGTTWENDICDYFHAAVVKSAETGTPEIRVEPVFLDFYINPAKAKVGVQNSEPVQSENDPKYWEDIVPGRIIVGYYDNINVQKASLIELGIASQKGVTLIDRALPSLNCILVEVPKDINAMKSFIQLMKKNHNVRYAEPNRKPKLFVNPNDPYFNSYQWDKKNLNAPAAWDYGWGSDAISVAIIDQGTEYTHPDLQARYTTVKGYDYLDNDSDPKPQSSSESHGTFCSGEACATINNGIGIAGFSNSRLYSLRVGDASGSIDGYAAANGIQWCANNNVKVLSMSWGGGGFSTLQTACQNAWNSGALLFAASGNSGIEETMYPAGYSTVMAVGSIGTTNQRSSFSTYGSYMCLVAPGENICSTVPGSSYQYGWSGTSMSCPNAAGCAALVWSASTTLTNQEVKDILTSTAVDIAPAGWDKYTGYGKPDLLAAVQMAIGGGGGSDTGMITVYNEASATGTLYVSNITYKASWVQSVSPKNFSLSAGSSKGVTVIVGGSLSQGTYWDTLNIISNDPDNNPYLVVLRLRVGVGVEETENAFTQDIKLNVFPNPFSQKAEIRYQVLNKDRVSLKLYNLSGRLVNTLADKEVETGTYTASINPQGLPSGIYFLKFYTGSHQSIHKLVFLPDGRRE